MSKALMMAMMANRQRGQKGRRVGVEYEDWGAQDAMDLGQSGGRNAYDRGGSGSRSAYNRGGSGGRNEYQVEQRFRDRDGREHYDNGRFAPENSGVDWLESGRRGGARSEFDQPMGRYPGEQMPRSWYDPYRYGGEHGMPMIGFSAGDGFRRDSGMDASYPRQDEMAHRHGTSEPGYSQSGAVMPMDRQRAEQWVGQMQNADGTQGPHWSMEQTEQIRSQQGIQCDSVKFWVTMNMMYSDYCKVGEKMGVNNAAFYACLAKAFLEDQDAQPEKLARYYEYIARH